MVSDSTTDLVYLLEHQPNIYCYQLYVTLPSTPLTPRVSLEVLQPRVEELTTREQSSAGAVLRIAWTAAAAAHGMPQGESHGTAALPSPLTFTLDCPGVTRESMVAGIESAGQYLHVKVQPPPIPIDAHRLVSLEQQSKEKNKLPAAHVLETVHCRQCSAPLHKGCPRTTAKHVPEEEHTVQDLCAELDQLAVQPVEDACANGTGMEHGQREQGQAWTEEQVGKEPRSHVSKVHELPSENWLEMADLWVCGCCGEGGTRGRFKHFALEEIKAKSTVGLLSYSGNYLMLHASYLPCSLPLGPAQEGFHAWKPVLCPSCRSTLGVTDRTAGEETNASYKLFFHCISTGSCAGEPNWFERFSVESKLAQMVYELAKSRHCFRICVYISGEREPMVLIRVMNWATSIQSNVLPDALATELVPVVKLLFTVSEEKNFKNLSDSWCIMGKGKERLDLLPEEAQELRRLLEANAAAWPPAMRNAFPNQQLSFLCLDSRPELPRL